MNPKRVKITGTAIAVRGNDIDTDRIIPARYLRCVTFDGLGEHAFEDDRAQLKEAGQLHSFDDPTFAGAELLFVNKNFGCGSSREHAPQSMMRWGNGLKALVGESFAEIFYGNCKALGIPAVRVSADAILKLMAANESAPDTQFTLDLESRTISFGGEQLPVELPDSIRKQMLEGAWDTMAELLGGKGAAAQTATKLPYWNHWATA
ncbi:MAG: isopropylmalate isomerase [Armatimonadetes bacterium CG_4_10_14_3_um_filter_66_18]|nr:3-isopropylmalate dehydratase small subunit [Armatimonadota bacterium]OIO99204.1 MAG: isopropylmalate isomerase [Armatimonadetes bacterium CG2_30_66_41]PIX45622.1 MAG: isopropylmalate isomerase [Armatimonadetes bacterium CG_4_8_14_3_um_filter_66_20]PIY44692.1 MAG: isopropylmalate isomerase [Armatimonadetes bacterium CG_4_10_14_3_um_filter_66_18]PIZ29915.1 MAG: isopropylmalate isomerase [Armatimonadetes bacterium CG_4_10_14_0_8_um_filter_66_14]PJB69510.1 MAG: isopropylmalate isomerase [Armat